MIRRTRRIPCVELNIRGQFSMGRAFQQQHGNLYMFKSLEQLGT